MGLDGALRWYVDNFVKRTGIGVELVMPGRLPHLLEPARLTAFRLVQQALSNVHRHSGSKTAKVVVGQGDGALTLEVADEGRGIPPDHVKGLGLAEHAGTRHPVGRAAGNQLRRRRHFHQGGPAGYDYDGIGNPLITRKVSRAISNSSLVGITKIRIRLEAVEISLDLPMASWFRPESIS